MIVALILGQQVSAWCGHAPVLEEDIALANVALDLIGYQANAEQTDATKTGLVFLMGGIPIIGYVIGIAAFTRFKFSEEEHARIRSEVAERN